MGTKSKNKGCWLNQLVTISLFFGFSESLAMFFFDRVRGGVGSLWIKELFETLFFGMILDGFFVYLLGVILFLISISLRQITSIKTSPFLISVLDRVASLPVLFVFYIWFCLFLSEIPAFGNSDLKLYVSIAYLILLFLGLYPFLVLKIELELKLKRILPVLIAPLLCAGLWFSLKPFGAHKFTSQEEQYVLVQFGVPVLLYAVAWSINRKYDMRFRSKLIVFGSASLLVAFWIAFLKPFTPPEAISTKPNVIMIVIDTLREDRVWGPNAKMPQLKKLAEKGIYYTRAYTPIAKTQQSMASIMTGFYPWKHNVRKLYDHLSPAYVTLAEMFSQNGYRTAAFVHNSWIDYGMGLEQGYHQYYGYRRIQSCLPLLHALLPVRFFDKFFGLKHKKSKYQVDGRIMTDQIIDWIGTKSDQPYFIWVHYFDPHWPYIPPPDSRGGMYGQCGSK